LVPYSKYLYDDLYVSMSEAEYIHEAFKRGDLETLLIVLDDPPAQLNVPYGDAFGHCLEYAIYHSPLSLIQQLLELGADSNYGGHSGFPSLIAAITTPRPEKYEVIELLISFGANLQQRGINGFTPLHCAAADNDTKAIELLLSHGADVDAKTDVDDFTTPLEEAKSGGCAEAVQILQKVTADRKIDENK